MGGVESVYLVGFERDDPNRIELNKEAVRKFLHFPGTSFDEDKKVRFGIFDTGLKCHKNNYVAFDNPNTENPHGTHVAGILGYFLDSKNVVLHDFPVIPTDGVLYKLNLTSSPWNYQEEFVKAFHDAMDQQVDVIVLSQKIQINSDEIELVIRIAQNKGIIIIVPGSSANDGDHTTNHFGYLTMYDTVLTIGSIGVLGLPKESKGIVAPSLFMSENRQVDYCMFGDKIVSTLFDDEMEAKSGISMAAALFASLVGWIILENKIPRDKHRFEGVKFFLTKMCRNNKFVRGMDERQVGDGLPSWAKPKENEDLKSSSITNKK